MPDFRIDISSFPNLHGQKDVLWAPIFVRPIVGSPERLIAAVAVVGERDHIIASARGLEKLRCLYGENAPLVIAATEAAISELDVDLTKRNKQALLEPARDYHIISIGEVRESKAKSLRAFASSWLHSISSLHENFSQELLLSSTEYISEKRTRARGDILPLDVFRTAVERGSAISAFFSPSIKSGRSRRSSISDIKVDFSGKRVVANFTAIRPVANVRGEFDRLFKRLWELDVTQVRSGHQDSDAVNYELIIQKPDLSIFAKDGDKINRALEELGNQADDKNLILRQFSNAKDMVKHLEKREAA